MQRYIVFVWVLVWAVLSLLVSCQTQHELEVKPVEVKPIHITIDINVRVEKELDDFFDDIYETEDKIYEEKTSMSDQK